MGLLERENAAIMNESLKPLCRRTVQNYGEALRRLGLTCPFYLTKNDGTLVRYDGITCTKMGWIIIMFYCCAGNRKLMVMDSGFT